MTVMERRLAAILERAGKPGRRFITVPHSPLLEGLRGLERAGLIRLHLTEGRKGIYRANAFWVGGDHTEDILSSLDIPVEV